MRGTGGQIVTVLVLGIGNILKGDDGLGVHALRLLEEEGLEGADLLEVGTSLVDAFSVVENYDHVVALDAVAAGGAPAALYWLPRERFVRARAGRMTLHDEDLLDALDLAELRGRHPVLHVAGMEPCQWNDWRIGLSAPVQQALPDYVAMVRCRVRRLIGDREEGRPCLFASKDVFLAHGKS